MTDKRIETYLRKSTRGLWGKKREEVREELASHIEGRVHAHLVGGLRESDAIEKTLTELGQPSNVSAGMARLYTLPVVAGSGLMLAMCCALVVVMLSGSTAQTLNTVSVIPADECLEPEDKLPKYCEIYDNFTTLEALQKALEGQSVKLGSVGDIWTLKFQDNHTLVLPYLGSQTWMLQNDDGKDITIQTRPEYFSVSELIKLFSKSSITSVRLEGWEAPTVYLDEAPLGLSSAIEEGGARKFYLNRLWDSLLREQTHFLGTVFMLGYEDIESENKRFELNATENTVYGIAIVSDPGAPLGTKSKDIYELAFYTDVALANTDGSVNFQMRVSEEGLTFKTDVTELSNFGDAVIIQLTGDISKQEYTVIPPAQITLE